MITFYLKNKKNYENYKTFEKIRGKAGVQSSGYRENLQLQKGICKTNPAQAKEKRVNQKSYKECLYFKR